jgi:TolA-binding protein
MRLFLVLPSVVLIATAQLDHAAEEKPIRFVDRDASPYFERGPVARAITQLRLEDWAGAATSLWRFVQTHPHDRYIRQASFLTAYAELKAGQFNRAATHFDALSKSYALLADYAHVWSARAHLAVGRPRAALRQLKAVTPTAALAAEALFLRAEVERALGHNDVATRTYREYLERYPDSWRIDEARFRFAELLDADNEGDAAQQQWRALYLAAPHETWGEKAAAHVAGVQF